MTPGNNKDKPWEGKDENFDFCCRVRTLLFEDKLIHRLGFIDFKISLVSLN